MVPYVLEPETSAAVRRQIEPLDGVSPASPDQNSALGPESPMLQRVDQAKKTAEASVILSALNQTRWNRRHAADLLQIDYKALLYKMKKLQITA
jgi:DNA-binding NtrC family response regulator